VPGAISIGTKNKSPSVFMRSDGSGSWCRKMHLTAVCGSLKSSVRDLSTVDLRTGLRSRSCFIYLFI